MSQFISSPEITRPGVTQRGSSLLDHVEAAGNLKPIAKFGLRSNEGLWQSYNCLDLLVPTPICPNPRTEYKTFQSAPYVPGFEFAVHGGVQCSLVGLDLADQMSELERVFRVSESKGVERALLVNRFTERTIESDEIGPWYAAWDAPVDLTPSTPVSLAVALALLEGYAAAHYNGVPTIHMPVAVASILNERIVWKDGLAYTRNGSKVVIGGGYDYANPADYDGSWDMYVTGEVFVEQSQMLDFQEPVLPGDGSGTGSGENGLEDNTGIALVERMYRVGVDCLVAKVTGSVTNLSGGAGFGN